MAIFIIMIIEGLIFLYEFLTYYGFIGLPCIIVPNITNNYLQMIRGVIMQYSIVFGLLLLIMGSVLLYKRIKTKNDQIIEGENVLHDTVGFLIFFGFLIIIGII